MGVDETRGRFGEVSLETCRACGSLWLRYRVEYEGFSESGRWYMGSIDPDLARRLTPDQAVALLDAMPWRFCGGSYFHSAGMRCTSPVRVDL